MHSRLLYGIFGSIEMSQVIELKPGKKEFKPLNEEKKAQNFGAANDFVECESSYEFC